MKDELNNENFEQVPKLIGTLTKAFGIKGYERADIGHLVFEHKDRHVIYLTPIGGGELHEVTFYKGDLSYEPLNIGFDVDKWSAAVTEGLRNRRFEDVILLCFYAATHKDEPVNDETIYEVFNVLLQIEGVSEFTRSDFDISIELLKQKGFITPA